MPVMVKIDIDPGAGFCFGVEQVIGTAESYLKEGGKLYGLGDMVHNSSEVKRLEKRGLKTISHQELPNLQGARVLLRAHGEPPSTFETAKEHQIEILDGTCPIVYKLQERIRNTYLSMDRTREQLVIFGKSNHPETIGLLGQVDGDAVVVSSPGDLDKVDPWRTVHLFSQTTMDPDQYREVEEALKHLTGPRPGTEFKSNCTICGQMKKRKPGLKDFALRYDVVVFVSGKHSSNGRMLFEFCASLNPRTHWISEAGEIESDWFNGAGSVGISGATSTSGDQLNAIREAVEKLTSS